MKSRSGFLRPGILASAAEISGQRQLAAPRGRLLVNAHRVSISRSVWSAVPRGTALRRAHPLHTDTASRVAGPDPDSGGSGLPAPLPSRQAGRRTPNAARDRHAVCVHHRPAPRGGELALAADFCGTRQNPQSQKTMPRFHDPSPLSPNPAVGIGRRSHQPRMHTDRLSAA